MIKDFFYYSNNQKRGIVILLILCIIFISLNFILKDIDYAPHEDSLSYQRYNHQLDSVLLNSKAFRRKKYYNHKSTRELFKFNPNKVDSLTLIRLGLNKWVITHLLNYRRKGGVFRTPKDFKKIYGLSTELFKQLYPYIIIDKSITKHKKRYHHKSYAPVQLLLDTLKRKFTPTPKFSKVIKLSLNVIDTITLKKIPGIGSYIAAKIVSYRKILGGYISVKQLREINLNDSILAPWFFIDTIKIKRLEINSYGVSRLKAHPYLNFYQAKRIYEHRYRYGDINSFSDLKFYDEFSEDDFNRLKHYVSFKKRDVSRKYIGQE